MDIGDFGAVLFQKGRRFRVAAIFEVRDKEMAESAHAAGATAVVLTAPARHAMDNSSLLSVTQKAIYPTPIIVKVRVGHYPEAEEIDAWGIADAIDECELLGIVDDRFINKEAFKTPFICGCTSLADALNRVNEGASVLRTQGNSGDMADTLKIVKSLLGEIVALADLDEAQLLARAAEIGAPPNLVIKTKEFGRLPVPFLAAGGIVTPADAALMIRHGCDGVIVNSGVLIGNSKKEMAVKAKKIVKAVEDAWRMVHGNGN